MRFFHTKCGGEIDVKRRQCMRCKKKWNPIYFSLDPTGIRPMLDRKGRPLPDLPTPEKVASKLPQWPRWARITVSSIVVALIILLIYLLRKGG